MARPTWRWLLPVGLLVVSLAASLLLTMATGQKVLLLTMLLPLAILPFGVRPAARYCATCGAGQRRGDRFCPTCGAALG